MIRQLRIKFITVCMLAMLIVLVVLMVGINGVNIINTLDRMDTMLAMLAENGGVFPHFGDRAEDAASTPETSVALATIAPDTSDVPAEATDEIQTPVSSTDDSLRSGARGSRGAFGMDFNAETPFTTRYFSVGYDADGEATFSRLDSIAAITQTDALLLADKVYALGRTKGWQQNYRYLRAEGADGGCILVFLDGTMERLSLSRMALTTLLVALVSYLGICILVFLFSPRAIRPFVENIEKQKHFITDASHELKTPLTVIATNSDILEMNYGQSEWTSSIARHVERMRKLIDQMVTLSRLDENRAEVSMERFNFSDAVYDTVMTYAPIVERRGKRLNTQIDSDLELNGDEASLRRMTAILMDNAVKYCDDGGAIEVLLKKSVRITLTVQNSYAAVGQLELIRLFDRFYRADEAHTSGGSYGLGLAIAQSIAEQHGARLRVRNIDGCAIQFVLTLQV